ncbi:MAG: bifunctional nuclease family protein [Deltaproteobacteria bacterium]|nr:MAG: bifunctional nuclease family protein [Deltaproteobacteria bacterium]
MVREMRVSVCITDQQTNETIVVLEDSKGNTLLPIRIGPLEGTAIAAGIEQMTFPRPLTHDLIKNILDHVNVRVDRVEICDLRNDTFYAWIYIVVNEEETKVDARPSDALAIALRTNAPTYVNEKVLQKYASEESGSEAKVQGEEADKWAEELESLSPEDFGKYKM